ncbi:MAG: NUDIX domain-containing protein [Lachnospiraceae bacterium]|nr:NUDIX domain-containing protein [Lachnospiraceae bacterium]
MITKIYELNGLKNYKYVVVISQYNGKLLLSRHKDRSTWETQGGHIEKGETPLQAAKRELYEESGAVEFEIKPLCDYWSGDDIADKGESGMVFTANIKKLSELPNSEMAEIRVFEEIPENLTYPQITPELLTYFQKNVENLA